MVKKDKEGDLLKVIEFGEGDWPLQLACDIFANLLGTTKIPQRV
jgi:hypothetical protein